MGTVYEATDPDLGRKVAVKLLRADTWSEEARRLMRSRLLREAQAMARLSHPEVITVYDVGSFGDQLFVAMEYVEGETLRRWRAARYRSYRDVLAVYERAGSGLAAAHEAGLVHRDFKPDNVLVGRDGRVRVTDFGLARTIVREDLPVRSPSADTEGSSESGTTMTITRTGALLGTPAYMAPEQLRGGTADARSDVFSFCVALYEALYGERPFVGPNLLALQTAIENGEPRAAPIMTRVPRWARAVLLRGLRATPNERYPSMQALLDALRAFHAASRRRKALAVGVGALLGLGALAAFNRSASGVMAASSSKMGMLRMTGASSCTPIARPAAAVPTADVLVTAPAAPSARSSPRPRTQADRPKSEHTPPAPAAASQAPAASSTASPLLIGHNGALILE
jgi:serine/threonine protein kinase